MRAAEPWRNAFESLFPQELARQEFDLGDWQACFCSNFAASGCEVHALPLSDHEAAVLRWTAVVLDERILNMQQERRSLLLPTPPTEAVKTHAQPV